jgi:tetratricopeptide (TPR) repeat protein
MWAERYEEQLDNIFSLQKKITQNIVEVLSVKLTIDEKEAVPKKETDNLEAYLTFLKGWQHYRRFDPDEFLKAIPLFEKAIDLDPNNWRAYGVLAKIYMEVYQRRPWRRKLQLTPSDNYRLINLNLKSAMKGPTPLVHEVAIQMHTEHTDFEAAVAEAEKAISLDPNDPDSHLGRQQEAEATLAKLREIWPQFLYWELIHINYKGKRGRTTANA